MSWVCKKCHCVNANGYMKCAKCNHPQIRGEQVPYTPEEEAVVRRMVRMAFAYDNPPKGAGYNDPEFSRLAVKHFMLVESAKYCEAFEAINADEKRLIAEEERERQVTNARA